jgi:hypothetical protein
MGQAIGQSLPFAVAVALSPGAIVLEVLMLLTPRGRATGPALVVGRALGIGAIGAILLAIASPADASDHGHPATWVDWVKLILGLLLLVVAAHQWRAAPAASGGGSTPKWLGALDQFTPLKAAGTGLVLACVNLKNLLLIAGAAAAVAQTGISAGQQTVAWIVFTVIASVSVAAPPLVQLALGARAASHLEALRSWMVRNNGAILAVICVVFAAKLIGDAIAGFSG